MLIRRFASLTVYFPHPLLPVLTLRGISQPFCNFLDHLLPLSTNAFPHLFWALGSKARGFPGKCRGLSNCFPKIFAGIRPRPRFFPTQDETRSIHFFYRPHRSPWRGLWLEITFLSKSSPFWTVSRQSQCSQTPLLYLLWSCQIVWLLYSSRRGSGFYVCSMPFLHIGLWKATAFNYHPLASSEFCSQCCQISRLWHFPCLVPLGLHCFPHTLIKMTLKMEALGDSQYLGFVERGLALEDGGPACLQLGGTGKVPETVLGETKNEAWFQLSPWHW